MTGGTHTHTRGVGINGIKWIFFLSSALSNPNYCVELPTESLILSILTVQILQLNTERNGSS
jgi:hypothetical protein